MDKEAEEREASMQKEIMRLRSVVHDFYLRLETGRNYLMVTPPKDINAADTLKALGYGPDGLDVQL